MVDIKSVSIQAACITAVELNCFCDTSEREYAATVYLQIIDSNGSTSDRCDVKNQGGPNQKINNITSQVFTS